MKKLQTNDIVRFHKNKEIGVAIVYNDNEGLFAVVVLSRNPYLAEITETLGFSLLLLVFFTGIVLFFISRLYATKVYR